MRCAKSFITTVVECTSDPTEVVGLFIRKEHCPRVQVEKRGLRLLAIRIFTRLKAFSQAISRNPDSADAWNCKSFVLGCLGRDDKAAETFRHALRIDSRHPVARMDMGIALDKLGRHGEAVEAFDQILRIGPNVAIAGLVKGLALNKPGRHREAIECFDHVLSIDPTADSVRTIRQQTEEKVGCLRAE